MTRLSMFYISSLIGTLMALSSSTWFFIWIGMEINLISFVIILTQAKARQENFMAFIYFLFQEVGSYLLLVGVMLSLLPLPLETLSHWMVITSLSLKIGLIPLHYWVLPAFSSISWFNCLFLIIPQKLAPIFILAQVPLLSSSKIVISICALTSILWGAQAMMNMTLIRQIIAYSSINQTGWMTMLIVSSPQSFPPYFLIYSTITVALLYPMSQTKARASFSQSNMPDTMDKSSLMFLALALLSLSGLPPAFGFTMKWLALSSAMSSLSPLLTVLMMIAACVSAYAYLSLAYKTFILAHNKPMSITPMNYPLYFLLTAPLTLPLIYTTM
uniref:NADH-ubiquinone oxidoreductase chain 2 n=1 Tax=Terebratulina retusa TaxID=7580 RepID=Q9T9N2_9BILA|nr:NADH dehydrogenase subunit 2 [Terebratulina retusa]CAB59854.1 NADH dehydrogenase subunit 2 [Terebratulina retusa]